MADAALPIGVSVTIDVQNPKYANRGVWMVVDNFVDRTVVEQTDSEGQLCRISAMRSNCHSLALCIPDSKLIEIQKEEVLAQLKDKIAKNGFNEHLLEDSDILSIARSKHLQLR